jgi:prenylcysteine alpha-carboxyl methylesterase
MGDGAKKATATDYGVSAVQLSRRLLWYSWVPWVVKIGRLLLYALVLLPGFARVLAFYLLSSRVKRGLRYGPHSRNFLDVYLPPAKLPHRSPTIVFVTGGYAFYRTLHTHQGGASSSLH